MSGRALAAIAAAVTGLAVLTAPAVTGPAAAGAPAAASAATRVVTERWFDGHGRLVRVTHRTAAVTNADVAGPADLTGISCRASAFRFDRSGASSQCYWGPGARWMTVTGVTLLSSGAWHAHYKIGSSDYYMAPYSYDHHAGATVVYLGLGF